MLLCHTWLGLHGQAVNEKVILQLSQPPMLRVDAGSDMNLDKDGSALIGESVYVTGGTPEYSFLWRDEMENEFYRRNPVIYHPGIYRLTVRDENNCTATDSLTVNDFETAVLTRPGKGSVFVEHDHSNRLLQIKLEGVEGTVSVSLVTMEGRVVHSGHINAPGSGITYAVGLHSMSPGVYLLVLGYEGSGVVEKIIVNEAPWR